MMKKKIYKLLRLYGVMTIGLIGLILACSEENPEHPLTITEYLCIKGLAIILLAITIVAGRHLAKKGLLP